MKKLEPKQIGIILGGLALMYITYTEIIMSGEENTMETEQVAASNTAGTLPVVTDTANVQDHTKSEAYEQKKAEDFEKEQTNLTYDQIFELAKTEENQSKQQDIEKEIPVQENLKEIEPEEKTIRKAETRIAGNKRKPVQTNRGENKIVSNTPSVNATTTQETRTESAERRKGFYSNTNSSSGSNTINQKADQNFIHAVVHDEHVIKSGQVVKIRITEECVIDGQRVPKNTFVNGVANIAGERINVTISSFMVNNKLVHSSLKVYDQDGQPGIYIPGGVNQEINKDGIDEGIDGGRTIINVPVIGSFSTDALRKKANDPTKRISNGYPIYLKD